MALILRTIWKLLLKLACGVQPLLLLTSFLLLFTSCLCCVLLCCTCVLIACDDSMLPVVVFRERDTADYSSWLWRIQGCSLAGPGASLGLDKLPPSPPPHCIKPLTLMLSWQMLFRFLPDYIIMVAVCNRADHYIFALWFQYAFFYLLLMAALCNRGAIIFLPCDFYLSSIFFLFFPRLISAAADWMSTILLHMAWP